MRLGVNMTGTENLPRIGAVVRSNVPFCLSRKGASGRVKSILPEEDGATIVIQSMNGDDISVSAWEYSCFFEECDFRDVAWDYWATKV